MSLPIQTLGVRLLPLSQGWCDNFKKGCTSTFMSLPLEHMSSLKKLKFSMALENYGFKNTSFQGPHTPNKSHWLSWNYVKKVEQIFWKKNGGGFQENVQTMLLQRHSNKSLWPLTMWAVSALYLVLVWG